MCLAYLCFITKTLKEKLNARRHNAKTAHSQSAHNTEKTKEKLKQCWQKKKKIIQRVCNQGSWTKKNAKNSVQQSHLI